MPFKVLLPLIFILLLFQNCSGVSFDSSGFNIDKTLVSVGGGNGVEYDGKPYVRRLPEFFCEGRSAVYETIFNEIIPRLRRSTQNRCNDVDTVIDPKDLVQSKLNTQLIGYKEGIYEIKENFVDPQASNVFTEVWCQAKQGEKSGMDVHIKYNTVGGQAITEINLAQLSNGNVNEIKRIQPFSVSRFVSKSQVLYSHPFFRLEIPRGLKVSLMSGIFEGNLELNIDGLRKSQTLNCRLGGVLDLLYQSKILSKDIVDVKMTSLGKLAYLMQGPSGSVELYTSEADGSQEQALTTAQDSIHRLTHIRPSPDGEKFAFKALASDQDKDELQEVYIINRDGSGLRQLSCRYLNEEWFKRGVPHFRFTPDGQRIIYKGEMQNIIDLGFMTVSVNGGSCAPLHPEIFGVDTSPNNSWGVPNVLKLAQVVGVGAFDNKVFVAGYDGSDYTKITVNPGLDVGDYLSSWTHLHPLGNGKRVVYGALSLATRTASGVYSSAVDASGTIRLLNLGKILAVSPKGGESLLHNLQNDDVSIYSEEGQAIYSLGHSSQLVKEGLQFSPDGSYLFYVKCSSACGSVADVQRTLYYFNIRSQTADRVSLIGGEYVAYYHIRFDQILNRNQVYVWASELPQIQKKLYRFSPHSNDNKELPNVYLINPALTWGSPESAPLMWYDYNLGVDIKTRGFAWQMPRIKMEVNQKGTLALILSDENLNSKNELYVLDLINGGRVLVVSDVLGDIVGFTVDDDFKNILIRRFEGHNEVYSLSE